MNDRSRILRLGFIGLGQATQRMFTTDAEIFELPYRITAAAEPRADAREAFRKQFNDEVYADYPALCASPNLDVIYVQTPAEMHKDHVIAAAEGGKHVIVDKPMALTLADCDAMIDACDRNGVFLLAGHTHGFDTPVRKMAELVRERRLGDLLSINSWHYNEFNPRPWPTDELKSTHGPLLNQGPHHVDIVRKIGGGLVKSVRAKTIWDSLRGCVGGYSCYLEFESGVPATLHYDARGFFDIAELYEWVGEGGLPRDPETNARARANFHRLKATSRNDLEAVLEAQKDQGRYGATGIDADTLRIWGYRTDPAAVRNHKHFGLHVISCDRGAIRQSPGGLYIYDEDGRHEIKLEDRARGRAAELLELYEAIVDDRPPRHDGRWGRATLEVCLAILESEAENREIALRYQVADRT